MFNNDGEFDNETELFGVVIGIIMMLMVFIFGLMEIKTHLDKRIVVKQCVTKDYVSDSNDVAHMIYYLETTIEQYDGRGHRQYKSTVDIDINDDVNNSHIKTKEYTIAADKLFEFELKQDSIDNANDLLEERINDLETNCNY